MAAPTAVSQSYAAGASGHNADVATGTFSWGAESQDAEDMIFVHCGFVPKAVMLVNETSGDPVSTILWTNTMPNISCFNIDDGVYQVTTDGIMGWDSSATTFGGGEGVVVLDEWYIKEGVAAQSGTFVSDKIIGFKVLSTTYSEGVSIQCLGTDGDTFHYIAWR